MAANKYDSEPRCFDWEPQTSYIDRRENKTIEASDEMIIHKDLIN
jgi:hypothetical protein